MTDLRKEPNPIWARDLFVGDLISAQQARGICQFRLSQFGYRLIAVRGGYRVIVNNCGRHYYCQISPQPLNAADPRSRSMASDQLD